MSLATDALLQAFPPIDFVALEGSRKGRCPHCAGKHARARSQMRCYGRKLRRWKAVRKIRLIKKVGVVYMTGDVMRRMCFDPGPWAKSWADRIDAELIESP